LKFDEKQVEAESQTHIWPACLSIYIQQSFL
jgi:hypothetical protein